MKIVHITHHYIDGWGYQDNLLPLYQYRLGNEITVISDKNHLDIAGPNIKQHILNKGDTYFLDGVKIRRIECILNTHNASLISKGLYKILEEENPDLIFHHGINTAMLVSAYYKSKHKSVILFVDSHADKFNQSRSKILYLFYYRILLRGICNIISSKVDQYYGVSVARCNYLNEVYGIPNKKIALLPLGGDTDLVDSLKDSDIEIQNEYNIPPNAFVIIHGGKMDKSKGTINLIKAFIRLCGTHKNFYLILFGRMSDAVKIHAEQNNIILINWCDRIKTIELLKFANVAVWPLLHTTLIEDAVSCGTPLIVKKSDNVCHLIKEDNGIYLSIGDERELENAILEVFRNYNFYKQNAEVIKNKYSYYNIANYVMKQYCNSMIKNKQV